MLHSKICSPSSPPREQSTLNQPIHSWLISSSFSSLSLLTRDFPRISRMLSTNTRRWFKVWNQRKVTKTLNFLLNTFWQLLTLSWMKHNLRLTSQQKLLLRSLLHLQQRQRRWSWPTKTKKLAAMKMRMILKKKVSTLTSPQKISCSPPSLPMIVLTDQTKNSSFHGWSLFGKRTELFLNYWRITTDWRLPTAIPV